MKLNIDTWYIHYSEQNTTYTLSQPHVQIRQTTSLGSWPINSMVAKTCQLPFFLSVEFMDGLEWTRQTAGRLPVTGNC
jgi:hypothetical protein